MNTVKLKGFSLVELLVVIGALGLLSAALTPAISNAVLQSNMTDVGAKGRDIFVAIAGTNTQRKLLGLDNLWPKTQIPEGVSWSVETDVSERAFSNSSDYFYELYDGENIGTDNWRPYVVGFDYSKLSGAGVPTKSDLARQLSGENNMWVIAANVRDEMADIIPVLVTRNVDCSHLYRDLQDGSIPNRLEWNNSYSKPYSDKGFVMIRKGGAIFKARSKYATVRIVYQNQSFTTTVGGSNDPLLTYLGPDSEQQPQSL